MKRLFVGITFFLTLAASVFAQNDLQPLAIVKLNKSETITMKELRARVEFLQKQTGAKSFTVEQKKQILDSLISEKLVAQAAAKENITITDSQVNQTFLNTFSQQLGQQVTEAQLSDLIQKQTGKTLAVYMKESTGLTLEEYKAYLKNQLVAQNYVMVKKQDEMRKVVASDDEIRKAYEMNKSTFVWNDMIKLFLVIVPKNKDPDAARSLADSLRSQYEKNPKSAEEKIKTSEDNNTKYQAGYLVVAKTADQAQMLGWSYDKVLELFDRKVGYLSALSVTDSDYQFYTVLKKYDAKMLDLSDVVEPDSTVTVYDFIKQRVTAQKQQQFLASAAQELAKSLDTEKNVTRKKTGDALTKALDWID